MVHIIVKKIKKQNKTKNKNHAVSPQKKSSVIDRLPTSFPDVRECRSESWEEPNNSPAFL
jgi:hypothetical protein